MKSSLIILSILAVIALAGCAGTEPTPDAVAVEATVAQRIFATLTASAPTATSVPSATPTVEPVEATAMATSTPTSRPTRQPTNTPRPTNPPRATNTPRPTATPTTRPGIGSVVRCNNLWEISVIEAPSMAKRLNVLDTAGYLTISSADVAKGEWLLLYFDLTNLQTQTDNLNRYDNELVLGGKLNGRQVTFEPSSWGTSLAQRSQGISDWNDDIPPGITITTIVIFDINPEATELELVLESERDSRVVCEVNIFLEDPGVPEGRAVAVASNAINVRTGPGTSYPVVGQTRAGQRLEITGKSGDANWLQVLFEGKDAWVAASVAPPAGALDEIGIVTDIPQPPATATPQATATPRATATPLPRTRVDQEFTVGIWGIRLYNVKKAKAVYFFSNAEIANGIWLTPMVELRNLGTNAAQPSHNLDFYLQDDLGRIYEFDEFNDGVLGAAWEYQTGKLYGDINPGLVIGTSLPFDVPPDMGDVWLRLRQDPNFAVYLGNVSQMP